MIFNGLLYANAIKDKSIVTLHGIIIRSPLHLLPVGETSQLEQSRLSIVLLEITSVDCLVVPSDTLSKISCEFQELHHNLSSGCSISIYKIPLGMLSRTPSHIQRVPP